MTEDELIELHFLEALLTRSSPRDMREFKELASNRLLSQDQLEYLSHPKSIFPLWAQVLLFKISIGDHRYFGRLLQICSRGNPQYAQQHAENVVAIALRNRTLFDRFVHDDAGFLAIKPYCTSTPEIHNCNSFQSALQKIPEEGEDEIRRASRVIVGQVSRTRTGSLFPLPSEIRENIAGVVGRKEPDMIKRTLAEEKEDTKIARKHSGKPS